MERILERNGQKLYSKRSHEVQAQKVKGQGRPPKSWLRADQAYSLQVDGYDDQRDKDDASH